jgi:chromosome partitioning protein
MKEQQFVKQGRAALEIAQEELNRQKREIAEREKRLNDVRTGFRGKEYDLWCLHAPTQQRERKVARPQRKPIIMVANLKGGVGKTTLTANLAAHFSGKGKRVLLIDVDYQGSLSNMMLSADGVASIPNPNVIRALSAGADISSFRRAVHPFANELKGSSIISAEYELAGFENQMMVEYLLQDGKDDCRYRLADLLHAEGISDTFDIAFIDSPPRLTAAAINAFCASTHLLIPTVYDRLSSEAVGKFLAGARTLRSALNHDLDLLGIVGMLTLYQDRLVDREKNAKQVAIAHVTKEWSPNHYFFERHIPRKAAIAEAAGQELAYFSNPKDSTVKVWFDELGAEVSERLGWDSQRPRLAERTVHRAVPYDTGNQPLAAAS